MSNRYNFPKRKPYEHPGRLFLDKYGVPKDREDLEVYADFLRSEAYAGENSEIRLQSIRWRFGIKLAIEILPDDTPGFTVHEQGLIFVNKTDSLERQRFTEAHELIELLYIACKESHRWSESVFANISFDKEKLCQEGAGALLIPREAYFRYLGRQDINLQFASHLAELFGTSFTATVHRMVNLNSKDCCMLVWQTAPSLHLKWGVFSPSSGTQPTRITVASNSAIRNAINEPGICCGEETLYFDGAPMKWFVEAKRIAFVGEEHILSLLRKQE